MKLGNIFTATAGIGLMAASGYLLVTSTTLDHGLLYGALIAGFILCDGSFWPGRPR